MKWYFKQLLEAIVILGTITLAWKSYEYIFLSEIKADIFDTFIALVLTFTIISIRRQAKIINQKNELIRLFKEYKMESESVIKRQQKTIEILKERIDFQNSKEL